MADHLRRSWRFPAATLVLSFALVPACGGGSADPDADVADVDLDGADVDAVVETGDVEDVPEGTDVPGDDGAEAVACVEDEECDDGNPCTEDRCDGTCVRTALEDGAACETDDRPCTLPGTCTAGVCEGEAERDCNDGNPCTVDSCDEPSGTCLNILVPVPGAEGPPGDATCDDGLDNDCDTLVDEGDANCVACVHDGDCDDGNDCTTDRCTGEVCVNPAVTDGTDCDDGLWCTVAESCRAGVCRDATPRDCTAEVPQCNRGLCDEAADACVPEPIADGTSCNDRLACNVGEICVAGVCGGGAPRDCSALSGVCRDGVCDETAGGCVARNHTAGTACDDGNPCTVSDVCTDAAACAGSPRDCGDADRCTVDSCNGTTGACEHVPTPIPGAEGPAGNATCGDGIDNDCDGRTDAADPDCGGCAGHADCDDADPCTTDTCVGGACAHAPAATGTLCNDGLWCTVGDACAAGTCAGTPRDCSAAAGVCTAGACDEDTDACRARPVADGTACDDGDPLTLRDVCVSGRCVASTCGDGYLDTGGGEFCDDGNILTETCRLPPAGSCIRDCSIQQPTCGNATTETALGESCDDGNADSFDACTTSCTVNDFGVGAPCTCTGSGCTLSNPTAGTINGCSGVVVPTGARLACFRSGSLLGNNMYFPNGFCSAYASTCSGFLCGMLGGGGNIGTYASFTTCPPGSVLLLQTISQTGITLRTKTCQKVCTRDSQCRWNEYDPAWSSCGQYECMSAPALPGTNVCFDGRSSAP